jgi:tRNA/rRNA methyltransferase
MQPSQKESTLKSNSYNGLLFLYSMGSVIFVEPESAGNIGSVARCMKNFGAAQLILVNPCPLEGARKMAVHAQDILGKVIIVDTLEEALALVDTSVGTTSSPGGFVRAAVTPREVTTLTGNVGIVIGRESSGLTNEEIEQCDFIVSIPASQEYPVLNAASACCILLYELFNSEEKEERPRSGVMRKQILKEFDTISAIIEKREHRKRIWRIVLRRVLSRAFLTERETTVLLGFFRRIKTVLQATPSQKR